jgi:hypothetical protein
VVPPEWELWACAQNYIKRTWTMRRSIRNGADELLAEGDKTFQAIVQRINALLEAPHRLN